ncbi:molybdopterin cofactor-binding domain-containing protein [Archangium violaceum]|uniref:molybdopterin cofactor-binding domain-containing protein n=1 Tax=Archangium violaceum TaxID=83451 RepID=UPI002B286214|nr:molybdopterin cofactor-binding domain-containing protein [Archangium gephyra]
MTKQVSFFLNGRAVTIEEPSPDLLLIDYLRSPEVGLAGPKKPCGQGGCGGCTVILSNWNEKKNRAEHRAINSCLRPVLALEGLVVTTVEGTGAARRPNPENLSHSATYFRTAVVPQTTPPPPPSLVNAQEEANAKRLEVIRKVNKARPKAALTAKLREEVPEYPSEFSHEGINPVAHRLAINNGTQCGYCTVGFVMNMSEFIVNNPKATKREIEDIFDGNICRCTGYRSILTGMKTFASNWTKEDEANRMKCLGDDAVQSQLPTPNVVIPFPSEARAPASGVSLDDTSRRWLTPASLAELARLMRENQRKKVRLVHSNTSYGIYKEEYLETELFLDVRFIPELNVAPKVTDTGLRVGAGINYSELIRVLESTMLSRGEAKARKDGETDYPETTRLGATRFMARRTAGRIVRNAASLGGNSMLVLKHIADGTGEPFPSDAFTALAAIDAEIEFLDTQQGEGAQPQRATVQALVERVAARPALAGSLVLLAYHLPFGKRNEVVLAQKVALRDVNAHSILNATSRLGLSKTMEVEMAVLVFGGVAPYPWRARKTEKALQDKPLSLASLPALAKTLAAEVGAELARWAPRMKGLPSEGFTDEYRVQLATAFFYKAVVNAMDERGAVVPPAIRSAGEITWGHWPVSDGLQEYAIQNYKAPVSQPYIKITAMEQSSGQLHYTHELPVPPRTVNASFVQSRRALAGFHFVLPGGDKARETSELREHLSSRYEGFVDLITREVFKNGQINKQGMGADQPIFAEGRVDYVGQSLALVLADTEQLAERIAQYVTDTCVAYGPVPPPEGDGRPLPPWWSKPILSLEDAIRLGSIYPDWPQAAAFVTHVWKVTRNGSRFGWVTPKNKPEQQVDRTIVNRQATLDGIPCQVVESTQACGGQVHFYMETQAAIAEPLDGRRMMVRPSTQSPMEMHQTTAMALGARYNSIDVQVPPVGGGYGGKTEQTRFVVGAAAIAAHEIKRPVRLVLSREQDTAMIGKRHAYFSQYQIAIDRGDVDSKDKGRIRGLLNKMWGDGGAFYDCSFIVSNCIQARGDNAYRIPNFETQIDVCRTNTAPSTAFRAFGDIQGKLMLENAVDDAAYAIGMLPEDVREKNLYERGDVTPFGQALPFCYIREVWSYLKQKCDYATKRREVDEFNAKNRWRKRGLAVMPVKYGSGYNLVMLEQAAAVVSVFQGDGSIVIHQGGVEMGQGLLTQVRQIAAYVLNVPLEYIQVEAPKTLVTPNPSSTGASTGTAYNGEAVKRTCQELAARLRDFAYEMRTEQGNDWCVGQGIDFWNHGQEGWMATVTVNGQTKRIWQFLVALAYQYRVSLVSTFTAPIRGGETPVPVITYKPYEQQPVLPGYPLVDKKDAFPGAFDSFVGFTYSAACSVVEVDILTGEVKVLSSDLVYDMGWSLNPAIDVGQVEGAFVQGLGYVLSEKLAFEPDGQEAGRLNSLNTWRYKPPATTSIPLELNVYLFPRNLAGVPEDPTEGIFSSKEVGEPPLVLATSVFLAVKAAIRASRVERKLSGLFRFDAPATVQEVRKACEVSLNDLKP